MKYGSKLPLYFNPRKSRHCGNLLWYFHNIGPWSHCFNANTAVIYFLKGYIAVVIFITLSLPWIPGPVMAVYYCSILTLEVGFKLFW